TPAEAARLGARVVQGTPALDSRAAALNAGAAAARGDVLLFLDADSRVPWAYDRAIDRALRDPHVIGGAFEFALDGPEWGLRLVGRPAEHFGPGYQENNQRRGSGP